MKKISSFFSISLTFILFFLSAFIPDNIEKKTTTPADLSDCFIAVLGIAQDGGYPHIGCHKSCCEAYWQHKEEKKNVVCLGIIDKKNNQCWMIEATPDITFQLRKLETYLPDHSKILPDGIFLTHAHIGHYTGLMELGREALNSKEEKVYAMPRMKTFLETNGPWSQLVKLNNINLTELKADSAIQLNDELKITPILVPHRDEFSETVGYRIESHHKKVLFIPDIDKWEKWNRSIIDEIKKVDVALLDGTFYKDGELPGRAMNEIPHPFVEESMKKFSELDSNEKSKIIFIHFNHTNPLMKKESTGRNELEKSGYRAASEGEVIGL